MGGIWLTIFSKRDFWQFVLLPVLGLIPSQSYNRIWMVETLFLFASLGWKQYILLDYVRTFWSAFWSEGTEGQFWHVSFRLSYYKGNPFKLLLPTHWYHWCSTTIYTLDTWYLIHDTRWFFDTSLYSSWCLLIIK